MATSSDYQQPKIFTRDHGYLLRSLRSEVRESVDHPVQTAIIRWITTYTCTTVWLPKQTNRDTNCDFCVPMYIYIFFNINFRKLKLLRFPRKKRESDDDGIYANVPTHKSKLVQSRVNTDVVNKHTLIRRRVICTRVQTGIRFRFRASVKRWLRERIHKHTCRSPVGIRVGNLSSTDVRGEVVLERRRRSRGGKDG